MLPPTTPSSTCPGFDGLGLAMFATLSQLEAVFGRQAGGWIRTFALRRLCFVRLTLDDQLDWDLFSTRLSRQHPGNMVSRCPKANRQRSDEAEAKGKRKRQRKWETAALPPNLLYQGCATVAESHPRARTSFTWRPGKPASDRQTACHNPVPGTQIPPSPRGSHKPCVVPGDIGVSKGVAAPPLVPRRVPLFPYPRNPKRSRGPEGEGDAGD